MDVLSDIANISTAELELSITKLCADINAATYRQLVMIAEFDKRKGWGDDGVRSCAHWLNWRCGISIVAAREKVRVAHALSVLPKTCEAFASGKLSYSKARAITRVGTEHNEDCLLSFAQYGTASQLDKTVRLYRRQYDSAGHLMVGYHQPVLPPDTDMPEDTQPDEQRYDAENQGAMHNKDYRQLASYWDEHGCLIINARLTAEQGALVLKALDAGMDELKEAQPTVDSTSHTLEQDSNDDGDINPLSDEQKRSLSLKQNTHRRADALVLMAEALLKDTKVAACTDDRYQVVVHVDSAVLAKDVFEKEDGSPDCYIEKQVGLPVETARRLSCSCKVVTALTTKGEPLSIGRSSRAVSTAIKRALNIRDPQCVFPGCDCHNHLEAHHIVHWANGGETSLENLIHVCHHHHTLLHEGQYSVVRLSNGELQFKRPDGQVLVRRSSLNWSISTVAKLPTAEVDAWFWNGDTMDYTSALVALSTNDRHHQGMANQ